MAEGGNMGGIGRPKNKDKPSTLPALALSDFGRALIHFRPPREDEEDELVGWQPVTRLPYVSRKVDKGG